MLRLALVLTLASCTPPTPTAPDVPLDPVLTVNAVDLTGAYGPTADILYDEVVQIVISGLPNEETVTLVVTGGQWESRTTFRADANGVVDTTQQAPESGAYEGADPDGPFWSMAASDDASLDGLFALQITIEHGGAVVAEHTLNRWFGNGSSTSRTVSEPFIGTLHVPFGPGPHPALVLLGGSEGGSSFGDFRGPYYAAHGYAALSLPYFGLPGLPDSLGEIPLEYVGGALDWLALQDGIDADSIGVVGASRGGELSLLVAAHYPTVRATVAEVPSGLVMSGFSNGAVSAAWTLDGAPLPVLPDVFAPPLVVDGPSGQPAYDYSPSFHAALDSASPAQLDAATIDVGQAAGPIYLVGGSDDRIWPSCELSAFAWGRLEARALPDRYDCFDGAGHGIGLPGLPTSNVGFVYHPVFQSYLTTGGTPAATARAQRLFRDAHLAFLDEHLR